MCFFKTSMSSLHSKDFNVFCQDYHSLLCISRLSESFVKDYHSLLYFSMAIKVLSCGDYQCFLPLYFTRLSHSSLYFKDFNVFCQDYHSLLYTSMSFDKTITIFFTFQRLQCLLSRLSQFSLCFQGKVKSPLGAED